MCQVCENCLSFITSLTTGQYVTQALLLGYDKRTPPQYRVLPSVPHFKLDFALMWTLLHVHCEWTTDVIRCWHTSYKTILWGLPSLMTLACAAVFFFVMALRRFLIVCIVAVVWNHYIHKAAQDATGDPSSDVCIVKRLLCISFCQIIKEEILYSERGVGGGEDKEMRSHMCKINLLHSANYFNAHFLFSLRLPLTACGLISMERSSRRSSAEIQSSLTCMVAPQRLDEMPLFCSPAVPNMQNTNLEMWPTYCWKEKPSPSNTDH